MSASFSPTPAEQALVTQIFALADPNKLGALTGDVAVTVFGGANLPAVVLGEIWQIADESNNGWLGQKGVAIAVRLMGYAQKGEKVSTALLSKPGPLPTIAGITSVAPQGTGASASRARSPQPLPPFTPQDKAKFQTMFNKSGPIDGLLSGEKAQEIFLKSKLPNETLELVWNLADTQDRGKLDATDFAIGMYLIQAAMTGQLSTIPNSLPPGFYQQMAGSAQSMVRAQTTGGTYSPLSSSFGQGQRSNIQAQYTGASQILQPQATGPWSSKPPVPERQTASAFSASAIGSGAFGSSQPQWDVTPAEKADSDRWFNFLDKQKRGYILDDVAVPFMLESKLSGDDLARIWDLADINNDSRLTRDGFAIAWYLIQKKRSGVPIPSSLPQSLVPPSMRAASGASPFSSPPEPPKDLFSWEEPEASPQPAAASVFQAQFSSQHTAFASSSRADPFASSNLAPAPLTDLLGDDEDTGTSSPPIHDKSAEIGNVQNQVNSTSRSLAAAQAERQALETTLSNQAAQLSALQTQLATAKAAYETETKLLSGLRERQSTQTAEMQKVQGELIRDESDLSAVRVEKSEIEGAFLRDKEEARALHKKMLEVSQQIDALKVEVEKSKKEAKQQKGLLAIARKQLSSKEAERAKLEKELQEAEAEAASIAAEKEQVANAIAVLDLQPMPTLSGVATGPPERTTSADSLVFAASHTLPASPAPEVGSPSLAASIKSNNPFDRLMGNSTPRSQSPLLSRETSAEGAAPDPFGFARAFDTDVSEVAADIPVETAPENKSLTPKPEPTPSNEATADDGATSESDVYLTPVTSSGHAFPGIDTVVTDKLPPAEHSESHLPGHFEPDPMPAEPQTDLGAQLKELDAEESDSSDSDNEEGVPLAALAKAKNDTEALATKTNGDAKPAAASFDDVFGVSDSTATPTPAPQLFTDAFGMAVPDSTTGNGLASQPEVTGVDAFDEALRKIPAATTPAQVNAFDSAFDDNFDFSSASVATENPFPPVPSAVNGHAVSPLLANASKNEFDSIFISSSNQNAVASSSEPTKSSPSNGPTDKAWEAPSLASQSGSGAGPTFDEVFAGFQSDPDLKNLGASLDGTSATTVPSEAAVQSVPGISPASSPKSVAPSQGTTRRSISPPPRHRSPPPPRSAKGRSSTGSSKEEKAKDAPPPRHSKLSLRLPFGKKKNKHAEQVPTTPSQYLTPPQEEPNRTPTPAMDDDVEGVKQLTAMGFSRSQAVDALEFHRYDVQKALNSLLGAQ